MESEGFLDLRVADPAWAQAIPDLEAAAARAAAAAMTAAGLPADGAALSLLLTDDAEIADLNQRFRERDAPTNVLSWPAFALQGPLRSLDDLPATGPAGDDPPFLGDVALALGTVRLEAESESKSLEAHAWHLIVHGVLHLLGYDHEAEDEAEAMMTREVAALSAIGVANPYADRP